MNRAISKEQGRDSRTRTQTVIQALEPGLQEDKITVVELDE